MPEGVWDAGAMGGNAVPDTKRRAPRGAPASRAWRRAGLPGVASNAARSEVFRAALRTGQPYEQDLQGQDAVGSDGGGLHL